MDSSVQSGCGAFNNGLYMHSIPRVGITNLNEEILVQKEKG